MIVKLMDSVEESGNMLLMINDDVYNYIWDKLVKEL